MAEALLVQSHSNTNNGAIAFVGTNTGAQDWELELGRYLFEAYLEKNAKTAGDMWKYMVATYYSKHNPATTKQDPDCLKKLRCFMKIIEIFQPAEHLLFGDPSPRVGGVK